MNQCVVNIQGYVRLSGFRGEEDQILPYIAKTKEGVYVVNHYGNAIYVPLDAVDVLM